MPSSRDKSRKRRGLSEIARLIEQMNDSGQTVSEFADRQGVSPASVYRWKRLIGMRQEVHAENAPVRIVAKAESGMPPWALPRDSGIRLYLPNGIECSLSQDFDGPTLARLLEML